jgi:hypothetical protein
MQQGYHFPPPDAQPAYGYSNPQLLAPQQWPQHGAPQPFEVNYQAYGADPGALQRGGHPQHQGYADSDVDFGDGYYDDEEPPRGKRWLLIAVALVGAIGVGGALAYTYRSIVAPSSRLVATKTDPVKVKVGSPERPPVRAADETAKATDAPAPEDAPPGGSDNQGPRAVKTITIGPGTKAPEPVIPGITLYKPPGASPSPEPSAKEETKEVQPPPSRVTLGTPPPAPPPVEKEAAEDDPPPVAPPAASKKEPVQAALSVPRAPSPPKARERPSGSGLGYVAVLKSSKTHMEAMTSFADMQQKYPEVLSEKSFDVQEADLSARGLGTMYRVVVGPPGSHNAASGVCARLKAAGYVGCWVKEY